MKVTATVNTLKGAGIPSEEVTDFKNLKAVIYTIGGLMAEKSPAKNKNLPICVEEYIISL